MSNSAPVATVFVDFKSAFDQLWFDGCLGKLSRMGIPVTYINWIRACLSDRRAIIEVQDKRSGWFTINRGGPQCTSSIRRRTIRRKQFVANNSSQNNSSHEQFVAEQFVAFCSSVYIRCNEFLSYI